MTQSRPAVTSTTHILPFHQISPRDFERLCLWLIRREGFDRVEYLGGGGGDQGQDIVAWREGKRWAFQCKLVRRFGPADAEREIDKALALPQDLHPAVLVFLVACEVSHETRRRVRDLCASEMECTFWALAELDERVKRHPDILNEFFQIPLSGNQYIVGDIPIADQRSRPATPGIDASDDDEADDDSPLPQRQSPGENQNSDTQGAVESRSLDLHRMRVDASGVKRSAASDQPIQNKAQDVLGFAAYADAIRDFIASEETTTPLTIGVDAPWGRGKTSLMRMIQSQLDPKRPWRSRFWIWLRLQGRRVAWLITSPLWYGGKSALWIADRYGWSARAIPASIAAGMRHPQSVDTQSDLAESTAAASWATASDRRSPIPLTQRLFQHCAKIRSPLEARHPTVWFNAWKFDEEEAIWSALAIAILDQIKNNYAWIGRFLFWLRLWVTRLNHPRGRREIFGKIVCPSLLGLIGWLWGQQTGQVDLPAPIGKELIQWVVWGIAILAAGFQFASIVHDPFSLSFKNLTPSPNYRDKIGFIGQFQEDFGHIVRIATSRVWNWKPRKLIIFIDDLDRCEPPKPAEVIEAINVFLDCVGCVFVIGMDSRAVVASIEAKYESLSERTHNESPGYPTLGHCFLEKIIQVPFAIPPISDPAVSALLAHVIGPPLSALVPEDVPVTRTKQPPSAGLPSVSNSSPAGRERREASWIYTSADVHQAMQAGVRYLQPNPRQMKRFVNLFRLQLHIANVRNLFQELLEKNQVHSGYTLGALAAWTALSMRWPRVALCLRQEWQQSDLRQWLLLIAHLLDEEGNWNAETILLPELARFLEPSAKHSESTLPQILITKLTAQHTSKTNTEDEQSTSSPGLHWCTLPWKWWLGTRDFRRAVKALEDWWAKPTEHQRDWLTMASLCNEL